MTAIRVRSMLFGGLVLVLAATAAFAQDEQPSEDASNQDVSPLAEGACPYDVPTWAESSIDVDELVVATGTYSAEQLAEFLNLGHPDARDALPVDVRVAQELVAYRLNLRAGFAGWVESDLAANEAEDYFELNYGGLPTPSSGEGDGENASLLAYLDEVLASYNLCGAPVF